MHLGLGAWNVHVEMVETIVESIESKHWGFSTCLEVILPALRGEHNFEKRTNKQKSIQILKVYSNELCARTNFSNPTFV